METHNISDVKAINYRHKLVESGQMDADAAMIALSDAGINVDADLGEWLREAEQRFIEQSRRIRQDDTVFVKGENGNPDFSANYRGPLADGYSMVIPIRPDGSYGLQFGVKTELISKIVK